MRVYQAIDYQCGCCYWIMKAHAAMGQEATLECINPKCKEYQRVYRLPYIEVPLLPSVRSADRGASEVDDRSGKPGSS